MKILVVDRDSDLREVLGILERVPGNEVQSARTGEEAIELTQGRQIDLLITEVMMEPMNGFTLRNKMESRHSGVRTIFVSGHDLASYAEHTAGCEVIVKPVTPQKLFPAMARAVGLGAALEASAAAAPAPAAAPQPPPGPVATQLPLFAATPRAAAAVPRAVAAPVATPRATPAGAPKARPGPVAIPAAAPKAAPGVAARPVAVAVAKATPVAVPVARPVAASPSDPMVGRTLGAYRIERRLGAGKWGPVYLAIQTTMSRPVAMEVLSEQQAGDETARQNFVATARAKAAVQYPHILPVYEADQAEGHCFYTHEYVDGFTLTELAARDEGLTEPTALQTIKYVAQGLSHLHQQRIVHTIPDSTDIYLGSDGLPRLSNVAAPTGEMPVPQEEICVLASVIRSVLPGGQAQDRGLQAMLTRMSLTNQAGFQTWPALFHAIKAIEPKVVPADAFKLSAQDEAAIRAVEESRKRQKRNLMLSVAGLFTFLCLLALAIWYEYLRPSWHDHTNDMVEIPAGPFVYQDGETRTLPAFYIDKYEVTIGEYEQFLKFLAQHGDPTDYDSPLQPIGRKHVPEFWDIYYGRASSPSARYRTVRGMPITLDCPVFNVDYFDAYAYAKWRGRRLPKEEEWEKAARGVAGNIYPWGNTWDPKKLNSGADYNANAGPGYKPPVDGFNLWAPVDAFPEDCSPYGVIGMGGNVSEWTDTWDPGKTYVVIRGGNYKSTAAEATTTFRRQTYPQDYHESVGFRTVSDSPPAK